MCIDETGSRISSHFAVISRQLFDFDLLYYRVEFYEIRKFCDQIKKKKKKTSLTKLL